MYRLTLSRGDRAAIDWVGNRYSHGDDLFALLWRECQSADNELDWDADSEITFYVPEHVAWQISELIEADHLACFASSLRTKLYEFQALIV